jgi:hypothetical protein
MPSTRGSVRTRHNLALTALAVSAALFMGCSNAQDVPNSASPQTLPTLPTYDYHTFPTCFSPESVTASIPLSPNSGTAKVYAMVAPHFDEAFASGLAGKLGIQAPLRSSVRAGVEELRTEGDHGRLLVYTARSYVWYQETAGLSEADQTEPVSDDEAKKAAEDFLKNLALWPQSTVSATVAETPNSIVVTFTPEDVTLAVGTSESIAVTLRKSSEVWQLVYDWQEPSVVAEYPIVSQAEALQRLRECRGDVGPPSAETMDVGSVELVYLGVPLKGPYEYLIPAYYFSQYFDNGARQVATIPAITDQYLTVNPPTPCPCDTPTP